MTRFLNSFALLALVVTAGCETSVTPRLPPLDSFYFPTGMAVKQLPSGKQALLVVSSNFDLQFDQATGGTVLAVDPDDSPNALPGCAAPDSCGSTLTVLGSTQMGSFGGEVDYADVNNCAQLQLPPGGVARVIATSRSQNAAYWMTLGDGGTLGCNKDPSGVVGPACPVALAVPQAQLADAYGVAIACGSIVGPSAFITHQRTTNGEGWVSRVSLNASDPAYPAGPPPQPTQDDFKDLGAGESYSAAFAGGRLYVTSRVGSIGVTPLRWLDLFSPLPRVQVGTSNFYTAIRGSLTRGLALSNDRTRGYMAVQLYDTALASTTGSINVLASLLAVLDLQPDPSGSPSFRVLQNVPIPAGPSMVKVLPPRTGKKDLVAVTCTDDGTLVLYDDETGAIAASIGVDQTSGRPILGAQPFGLAVEAQPRTSGCSPRTGATTCDRLYVGSFDRSWVNVVEVDPTSPSAGWTGCISQTNCTALVKRIGRERR